MQTHSAALFKWILMCLHRNRFPYQDPTPPQPPSKPGRVEQNRIGDLDTHGGHSASPRASRRAGIWDQGGHRSPRIVQWPASLVLQCLSPDSRTGHRWFPGFIQSNSTIPRSWCGQHFRAIEQGLCGQWSESGCWSWSGDKSRHEYLLWPSHGCSFASGAGRSQGLSSSGAVS